MGLTWQEPIARKREEDEVSPGCEKTPQELCRDGLYAAIRAKVSQASFWAVLALFSGLLFAVVWYSVGRADAACDKAAIASEKAVKVEQQYETLNVKLDLILGRLSENKEK